MSQNPVCISDDIFTLQADKELVFDDGGLRCEGVNGQNGFWKVKGGELTNTLPDTRAITFAYAFVRK